jgi:hypothetical protein
MSDQEKQKETDGFTERAIMSLVMEATEMQKTAKRLWVVVAAVALAHGISTEV